MRGAHVTATMSFTVGLDHAAECGNQYDKETICDLQPNSRYRDVTIFINRLLLYMLALDLDAGS